MLVSCLLTVTIRLHLSHQVPSDVTMKTTPTTGQHPAGQHLVQKPSVGQQSNSNSNATNTNVFGSSLSSSLLASGAAQDYREMTKFPQEELLSNLHQTEEASDIDSFFKNFFS